MPENPPYDKSLPKRAAELAVFASLGMASVAREAAPGVLRWLAQRGRSEMSSHNARIGSKVTQARTLGQLTMMFGPGYVRKEVGNTLGRAVDFVTDLGGTIPLPDRTPAPSSPVNPRVAVTKLPPIADYDSLSASQVIGHLAGLDPGELGELRAYEAAGRARRTVLAKIDHLTATA